MKPAPDIILTSAPMAESILLTPIYRKGIAHVLSIGEEGDGGIRGFPRLRCQNLRLEFDDVERTSLLAGYVGCEREHIEKIIDFAENVRLKHGRVMVHCAAGVSRSSAATLIMLTTLEGAGSEMPMAKRLHEIRAWSVKHGFRTADDNIRPNRRMVWMADKLLNREGALMAALEQEFGSRYRSTYEPPDTF